MAKKEFSGKPRKEKRSSGRSNKPKASPAAGPFDRRTMEGAMREIVDGLTGSPASNAQDRAQDLVYRAVETTPAKQVKLARQALDLWSDCADAYVLLAENAGSLAEATESYAQGMAAGERALGKDFKQLAGQFWGFLETRPYMRARLGLAECLYEAGQTQQAADHYRELLRLNPNDNQGVRDSLAICLFELGHDAELGGLLDRFRDDTRAIWPYAKVLHGFRAKGDAEETRKLLRAARKVNKYVPEYLLRDEPLPARLPDFVRLGSRDEAAACAASLLPPWKWSPGAISWLRTQVTKKPRKKAEARPMFPFAQPTAAELLATPQAAGEVWQADVCRAPTWVREGHELIRPWLVLVTNRSDDQVLAIQLFPELLDSEVLWAHIAAAIVRPPVGRPHRPDVIEVCMADLSGLLQARLEEIEVRCVVCDDLKHIDEVLEGFSRTNMEPRPALIGVPGIERDELGRFFEAAAAFYKHAPWRLISSNTPFRMECPELFPNAAWYGAVMGRRGVELGLTLYEDLELLRAVIANTLSGRQYMRRASALSLMFGEDVHLAARDLDAIERLGWPVAGPDAFPYVVRLRAGVGISPPGAIDLRLLEAALRQIPDFLERGTTEKTAAESSSQPVICLSFLKPD